MKDRRFIIHGDDKRNLYLAKQLLNDGYKVALLYPSENTEAIPVFEKDNMAAASCVHIFSPATSQKELYCALQSIDEGSICFGGAADDEVLSLAAKKNITYQNLLKNDSFCILNSIPTAEGALMSVMHHTDYTVNGSNVAVLGFGRIGCAVAKIFAACNAKVSVISREPDELSYAVVNGFAPVHICKLCETLNETDILLNTIPAPVVDKKVLSALKRDALVIDLASGKNNIDYKAADELGIKAFQASALPALVAPKSAAEYVKSTLFYYLDNQG